MNLGYTMNTDINGKNVELSLDSDVLDLFEQYHSILDIRFGAVDVLLLKYNLANKLDDKDKMKLQDNLLEKTKAIIYGYVSSNKNNRFIKENTDLFVEAMLNRYIGLLFEVINKDGLEFVDGSRVFQDSLEKYNLEILGNSLKYDVDFDTKLRYFDLLKLSEEEFSLVSFASAEVMNMFLVEYMDSVKNLDLYNGGLYGGRV